ncbi:MAG: HAD-IC family P-type ATPase, partial [Elusimicrobia bacterium]|nr:HAD-IC family P-type ATPase [Elusimicrobiota bacterium]
MTAASRWSHVVTAVSALGIAVSLTLRYAFHVAPSVAQIPLIAILVLCGPILLFDLAVELWRRELGADLLAGIAIVPSFVLKQYMAGAIIVLMLSGGDTLEAFAVGTASSVLKALAKRTPTTAHRKTAGGMVEVKVDQIAVGDLLVILPHEISPVDGVVVEGRGTMDESFLTGEPFQISKAPGSTILSGAVNGDTAIVMRATKTPVDSRYAKIMGVVKAAELHPPRVRRLGDQLGALYAPLALIVAVGAWITTGSALRFLAVLVIATPCPLIIAIPIAVIGSISLCARRGIVVKKPIALEQVESCQTIVFDKTGTLTYGRPEMTDLTVAPGQDAGKILGMAAALEQYSRHPLAQAIIDAAKKRGVSPLEASEVGETPGEGLSGVVDGRAVKIVGRKATASLGTAASSIPPTGGGLESVVVVDGAFAALLRFRDEPKAEGSRFIAHL